MKRRSATKKKGPRKTAPELVTRLSALSKSGFHLYDHLNTKKSTTRSPSKTIVRKSSKKVPSKSQEILYTEDHYVPQYFAEYSDLQSRLSLSEEKLSNCALKVEELQQKIEQDMPILVQFQAKLSVKQSEEDRLQEDLKNQKEQYELIQQKDTATDDSLQTLRQEKDRLQNQLDLLNENLEILHQECDSTNEVANRHSENETSLNKTLTTIQEDLHKLYEHQADLQTQTKPKSTIDIITVRSKLIELDQKGQERINYLKSLEDEVDKLTKANTELQICYIDETTQRDMLQDRMKELRTSIADLESMKADTRNIQEKEKEIDEQLIKYKKHYELYSSKMKHRTEDSETENQLKKELESLQETSRLQKLKLDELLNLKHQACSPDLIGKLKKETERKLEKCRIIQDEIKQMTEKSQNLQLSISQLQMHTMTMQTIPHVHMPIIHQPIQQSPLPPPAENINTVLILQQQMRAIEDQNRNIERLAEQQRKVSKKVDALQRGISRVSPRKIPKKTAKKTKW